MGADPIVLVHPLALPSPMANAVQTLATAAALARTGRRVGLFVRAPRTLDLAAHVGEAYGLDLPETLALEPLGPSKRTAGVRFRARLAGLVRSPEPTAFLSRSLRHTLFLLRARSLFARGRRGQVKRLVQEFHNLEHRVARERGDLRRAAVLERREARVARAVDALVSISAPLADDLAATFAPIAPLTIIEDGVDLARFRGVARAEARADAARMVYAGSFFPHKGVESLLDMLLELPVGVELELVGGHPEAELARLRARVAGDPRLRARVHFTGAVSSRDVPGALARADLIVLPAGEESAAQRYTSPLKLFEAMATGAPIVAAPSAAHASVLRDGETAFLAPDGSGAGLASGVRRVLADPGGARRVAAAALHQSASYDWDARAARLLAVLEA